MGESYAKILWNLYAFVFVLLLRIEIILVYVIIIKRKRVKIWKKSELVGDFCNILPLIYIGNLGKLIFEQ